MEFLEKLFCKEGIKELKKLNYRHNFRWALVLLIICIQVAKADEPEKLYIELEQTYPLAIEKVKDFFMTDAVMKKAFLSCTGPLAYPNRKSQETMTVRFIDENNGFLSIAIESDFMDDAVVWKDPLPDKRGEVIIYGLKLEGDALVKSTLNFKIERGGWVNPSDSSENLIPVCEISSRINESVHIQLN